MTTFTQQFERYSDWRTGVLRSVGDFQGWLQAHDLYDAQAEARTHRAQAVLRSDKLKVAFIAEFSRGKSELINALFFADYGRRILPSSAGRTTMCPTELLYDESMPIAIRLLPIGTHMHDASTADFRDADAHWVTVPLNPESPEGMLEAFRHVVETIRVPREEAEMLGLFNAEDADAAMTVDAEGKVEISRWRHAVINFPHPMLKQGLVILDTPGLNAIGTEPELTLRLIPDAHVVVFVLAADAGVTKSDLELWRTHVGGGHRKGCVVVLNKIDGLWDPLKTEEEAAAEIAGQVSSTARTLGIDAEQVYPVSAQKGLVAKVSRDEALLAKSRLAELEHVMSHHLIPQRHEIVAAQIASVIEEMAQGAQQLLQVRRRDIVEQLFELRSLRGKNQAMVKHMLHRVQSEKDEFEQSIAKFQALRLVFGRHSAEIIKSLQVRQIRHAMRDARAGMQERILSRAMREDMSAMFVNMTTLVSDAGDKIAQLHQMVDAMYKRFNTEHGFTLTAPLQFVVSRYLSELNALQVLAQSHFSGINTWVALKPRLVQSAFSTITSKVLETFQGMNRDIEVWLKSVMTPLEAQVREHQKQLRKRVDSIERIHEATDTLESRIQELEGALAGLDERSGTVIEYARMMNIPFERSAAQSSAAA